MRAAVLLVALVTIGCGSSSPTAPSTPPVTPPVVVVPPPVVQQMISVSACPTEAPIDVAFYRQIGCNAFENPLQQVRRWAVAPQVYLKTVDEAGQPVDSVTLNTVANALQSAAALWTGGKFSVAITRGTESREGVSGWVTAKWLATVPADNACGRASVAQDGGYMEFDYKTPDCGCNGSAIRPETARHELGHAFGYWHTDSAGDVMSNLPGGTKACDASPSARELQAASYQYR